MNKLFASAGLGMLLLAFGVPAAMHAQDEDKPPKQVEPKPEPKRQDEEKPRKQQEPNRQPEEVKQQEHRDQSHPDKPAGKGTRIPDDKFREHFGREHTVVIKRPVIVEGQPRFQYGGYWFVISDPWPAEWAYTDQCYIDYVDGEYFLFDLLHPGVRVALVVTL